MVVDWSTLFHTQKNPKTRQTDKKQATWCVCVCVCVCVCACVCVCVCVCVCAVLLCLFCKAPALRVLCTRPTRREGGRRRSARIETQMKRFVSHLLVVGVHPTEHGRKSAAKREAASERRSEWHALYLLPGYLSNFARAPHSHHGRVF